MSFWSSEDKIPIRQTKVSLPAENGLNYKAGQTIHFSIPPTVEFIQPKETYLRMDIMVDDTSLTNAKQRWQLDKIGGSVVIKDIRIYAGGAGGTLLEEIQDYNCLTALRYSYEQNDTLRNKRSLTEGGSQFNSKSRSTMDNMESDTNNVTENPNFDAFTDAATAQTTAHAQRKVKCLLPLHTGIFQNDKVFPCLLTDGLRIEILLENAPRCIVPLSQVSDSCKLNEKVIFHSRNGQLQNIGTGGVDDLQDTTGRWADTGADGLITEIFVRRDNSQTTAETFPFVVDEFFDFVDMSQNQTTTSLAANNDSSIMSYTTVSGKPMQIASIEHFAYSGNSAAVGGEWGLTKITLKEGATRSGNNSRIMGGNTFATACWVMVSRTLTDSTAAQVANLNLAITDVELIVQQLEMPNQYKSKLMKMMKEGGSLNYDFLSYRNYKSSALASDTQVNMRIPLVESRAKSILCVPTDSSTYTTKTLIQGTPCNITGVVGENKYPEYTQAIRDTYGYNYNNERCFLDGSNRGTTPLAAQDLSVPTFSDRSGLVGIWDFLTNYQLFYDGKLNPSRKVDCKGVSGGMQLSQQWAIEAEKSLAMAGIRPLSFRDLHENAFIGRALSLNDGVYDTRGKDFNLQLAYEGQSATDPTLDASPSKNKLWNCYCAHLRRLVVKGNAISLEV